MTTDTGNIIRRVDELLTEFGDLHQFNARRISLFAEMRQLATQCSSDEEAAFLGSVIESLYEEDPEGTIAEIFRTQHPPGLAGIYRKTGLSEARAVLESLVSSEEAKERRLRSPFPYHNLATIYHLSRQTESQAGEQPEASSHRALELALAAGDLYTDSEAKHVSGMDPTERETMAMNAYSLAALLHISNRELEECERWLQRASELGEGSTHTRFVSGLYHLHKTEYEPAIELLSRVADELDSDNMHSPDVLFHLARACMKQAAVIEESDSSGSTVLLNKARTCLEEAAELDPHYALAHLKLGLITLQTDCEKSMTHFGRALRSDAGLYDSLLKLYCPGTCTGCSGVKLKLMLLELLSTFKKEQASVD